MPFDADSAARTLIEAHRGRRRIAPPDPAPASVDEAYAVQDRVMRALGPVGGWKVGAKTPADEPVAAPLASSLIWPGPATLPASRFHMIVIESEIAFLIGRDVPAGAVPLAPGELLDAVASVHAAIEIVDSRFVGWPDIDRIWGLADNQSNGGFVHAAEGVAWSGEDFTDAPVRLTIDGEVRVDARGGNTGGDPGRLLAWCVDHVRRTRGGVPAGTIITTGTFTGMIAVTAGAHVEAEFPGIGTVSLALSA